jgi:hypothetical protein
MTSSDVLEELAVGLVAAPVDVDVDVDGGVVVDEVLDEQAAMPVARRPAAAIASALLLVIPLTVNFDPFLSVNAISRRIVFWEG